MTTNDSFVTRDTEPLPGAEPHVCGDCLRPAVYTDSYEDGVRWRHDRVTTDHDVMPLLRNRVDEHDIQPVCRFCLTDVPREGATVFATHQAVMIDMTGEDLGLVEVYSPPCWYACEKCAACVMSGDASRLLSRATTARVSGLGVASRARAERDANRVLNAFAQARVPVTLPATEFDGSAPWELQTV